LCFWDRIHNPSFSLQLTKVPNKLLCYITQDWNVRDKHSSLLGPFVSYEEDNVLWIKHKGGFYNTSFFSNLMKLSYTLQCYITIEWKGLLRPIHKLWRKWTVVKTPGLVFTTLDFLHMLWKCPISCSVTLQ
jgi:hypothetical protein